ncbi:MAG: hypothetical protein AAF351_13060 [Pseudomonadota bacterium]
MNAQIIFSIAFFLQVVVISIVMPRKISATMSHVMQAYPPTTHPRLYPRKLAYYESKQMTFRWLSASIALIGFAVLIGMQFYQSTWDFDDFGDAIAFTFFMLQAVPFFWLDLSLKNELKIMRALNTSSTRTADLNPRGLFDIISPALLGAVVLTYLGLWAFVAWFDQFGYEWFGGYANVAIATGINLFFIAIVFWRARGRKENPHERHEDRIRRVRRTAKMLAMMSIALTVYLVITVSLTASELRDLQPAVKSIYFLLIAALTVNEYRIDSTDFDVYRDANTSNVSTSGVVTSY